MQQLRVERVGAFGGVEALAVGRGGGLGGGEAGELLAQPVAGEQHRAEPVGQRPADGGLARAGQSPDQREPHGSGLEMPQAEVGVLRRVRRRGGVALLVAQARDLGADEGAVGHVVVAQGHRSGVPGELDVVVQPVVGEVGPAEPLQVHGEERHVVEAVDVAELVVELQAVQGARAVVEAEDVVGDEVAVAVDDPPVGAPVGEQRTAAGQEPGGQPVHRVDRLRRRQAALRPYLLDVRRPPAAERVAAALRGHVGVAAGGGVEGGDRPRQVPQVVPTGAPARTRVERRRSSGMRRITTRCSTGAPSASRPAHGGSSAPETPLTPR